MTIEMAFIGKNQMFGLEVFTYKHLELCAIPLISFNG
jgi:hypothetical protein